MDGGREWDDPGIELGFGEHDLGPFPLVTLSEAAENAARAAAAAAAAGGGDAVWGRDILEKGAIQAMRKAEVEYQAACASLAQAQARLHGIRDVMDELRGGNNGGGGGGGGSGWDAAEENEPPEAAQGEEGGAAAVEAVVEAEGRRQESKRVLKRAAEQLKAVLSGSQEQALVNDRHIELLDRGGQYQVASWLAKKVEEVCSGADGDVPGCLMPSLELALRDSHAVRFLQDLNYGEVLRIRVLLPGHTALSEGGPPAGLHLGWPDEYWSRGSFLRGLPYDEVLQIRAPIEWELRPEEGPPGGPRAQRLPAGGAARAGGGGSRRVPFADEDFFGARFVEAEAGEGADGGLLPPLESAAALPSSEGGLLSFRRPGPQDEELVLSERAPLVGVEVDQGAATPAPRQQQQQAASSRGTRALLLALVSICGGLAGGMVLHSELSVLAKDVCAIGLALVFAAAAAFAVGVFPRRHRQAPSSGGSGYVRPWGQVLLAMASVAAMLSVSTVLALLVKALEAAVLLAYEGGRRAARAAAASGASLLRPPGEAALGLRLMFAGEVALVSCSQVLSAAAWVALLFSVSVSVTAALLIVLSFAKGKQATKEADAS